MTKVDLDWLQARLSSLDGHPLAQARLLLCAGDSAVAWGLVEDLGTEVGNHYWSEFSPYGLGPRFPSVDAAAERLLEHNRPLAALHLLQLYARDSGDGDGTQPSPEIVARGLETLASLAPDHAEPIQGLSAYEIRRLLEYLANSALDEDRAATLEWRLLPVRGYGDRSLVLERRLARNPEFFVDVLSLCFKRRDGSMEQEVPSHVSLNAYRLLSDWITLPGSNGPKQQVNQEELIRWTDEARRLAAERDRKDIADVYIGHILAHAPADEDETWPTLPVRNLLERLANRKIEEGWQTGIYNKRGVTTRSLTEGGRQERELAEKFDRWAALVTDEWRRTARVLRSVADRYRAEAQREDEEAEQVRRGIDS
jgi:hypothetical protein